MRCSLRPPAALGGRPIAPPARAARRVATASSPATAQQQSAADSIRSKLDWFVAKTAGGFSLPPTGDAGGGGAAAGLPRSAPKRDFLEARQVSLFQLFDGNEYIFDIPSYQRPYAWRQKQVREAVPPAAAAAIAAACGRRCGRRARLGCHRRRTSAYASRSRTLNPKTTPHRRTSCCATCGRLTWAARSTSWARS